MMYESKVSFYSVIFILFTPFKRRTVMKSLRFWFIYHRLHLSRTVYEIVITLQVYLSTSVTFETT